MAGSILAKRYKRLIDKIIFVGDLPQLKSEIRKFDFPPRKFDSTWFVFDLFHVKSNLHGVRHIQYFLFCVNHVELNIRGGKSNLQISRQLEC